MQAETIAIGNELLLGDTINSNAAKMAKVLTEAGVACSRHLMIGDDQGEISAALNESLSRVPIVIVSGGLGPTEDDLTREAVAAALGRGLRRDPALVEMLHERFAQLGRKMPERNVIQADVIEGATVIPITFGTAPGQIIEQDGSVIYIVPGVPAEAEDMLRRAILPDIRKRFGSRRILSRVINVAGLPESEISRTLRPVWENLPPDIDLAYLPSSGEVKVKLTSAGDDEAEILSRMAPYEQQIEALLGEAVTGKDDRDLDEHLALLLRERGWSLAAAESITGGSIGARCTSRAGSSDWFRGSLVCYSTDIKRRVLGVPGEILDSHGAVSIQTAEAMATRVRNLMEADVGVSVTGEAGPDPSERQVGTVCIAVATPAGVTSREVRLPGDREGIRRFATTTALVMVVREIQQR